MPVLLTILFEIHFRQSSSALRSGIFSRVSASASRFREPFIPANPFSEAFFLLDTQTDHDHRHAE
jgi:hypothetical protein